MCKGDGQPPVWLVFARGPQWGDLLARSDRHQQGTISEVAPVRRSQPIHRDLTAFRVHRCATSFKHSTYSRTWVYIYRASSAKEAIRGTSCRPPSYHAVATRPCCQEEHPPAGGDPAWLPRQQHWTPAQHRCRENMATASLSSHAQPVLVVTLQWQPVQPGVESAATAQANNPSCCTSAAWQ
jgi:hypothetical protein